MTGNVADQPLTKQKTHLTRRNFLRGTALTAAGMAFYSGEIARHEISIPSVPIAIANLPEAFHGFRIAQLSDIHLDEFTEPAFLRRVIERINSLRPDIVALTGDYISMGPRGRDFAEGAMYHCLDLLRGITAPRYACMGNHDSILGAPMLRPIFRSYDIPLLMNEHLPIERAGQRLWMCGVGDMTTELPDLDMTIPREPDGPILLMCHAPDYADTVASHPRGRLVDLMMSGHSHGGQVRIPFMPLYHLPAGGQKYVEGHFRFNRLQLYVNRGIGTVGLPFRLNCPPEITLFTLNPA
ncbi:MAG TPA: metallophosphoesterase [Acidobacteriaceae bacterium]